MARRGILRLVVAALVFGGARSPVLAQYAGADERAVLEGCTIGVAAGAAASDGRPLLWKTRDAEHPDNEVRWSDADPFAFVAVFNAGGTSPWMGVNERGFAIVNANSLDLPGTGSSGNGAFMRGALAHCATVADFERLLDSTNETGRRTQAHFAAIDSTGAAALYEAGGFAYWKFDAAGAPGGFVIRTNFAVNGGGTVGLARRRRSEAIIGGLRLSGALSARGIVTAQLRDFADAAGNPYAVPFPYRPYDGVPFGHIPTASSICGKTSVSAAVFQGVRPGEPAVLTTMWTLLGFPAATAAVPFWPAGPAPAAAAGNPTAPLCDEARRLHRWLYAFCSGQGATGGEYLDSYGLRDEAGNGIWRRLLPAEEGIAWRAERCLDEWRRGGRAPERAEILQAEGELAASALELLRSLAVPLERPGPALPSGIELAQNYPNPFNGTTVIRFALDRGAYARLQVHDLLGRTVGVLFEGECRPGVHEVRWDGGALASGPYWYRLTAGEFSAARPLLLIR